MSVRTSPSPPKNNKSVWKKGEKYIQEIYLLCHELNVT